ncbi:MAG: GFA family protein [Lautropia sp.]
MSIQRSGQCVCGSVRYVCIGEPERVTICHCLWCQRRTGTAFGAEVVFQEQYVTFSGLTPASYRHTSDESGRWLEIYFCPRCGSNLGFTLQAVPGVRTVPAGALDEPAFLNAKHIKFRHVFARSRREWGEHTPDVEVHEKHFRPQ